MTKQERQRAERRAMGKERARIRKRQSIGDDWDGRPRAKAWPLGKALSAEGNTELLKYALRYRQIYDMANSGAVLGGKGVAMRDGFDLARYSYFDEDSGELDYKHARKSHAAADIPSIRRVTPYVADEESGRQSNISKVPRPWSGDRPVNDMIDAKSALAALRGRLGRLCEPLELAVIDGKTLAEVGNAAGVANRAGAMGAGRALVHTALVTLRDCMGKLKRRDLE